MTRLSVCVPTIGRASLDALTASVDAARERLGEPVDLVVADASGSARAPGARVVPNPEGTASAGRNAAAAAAQGDLLLFVDDDCRLDPDHLALLLSRVEREPRVAAWSGLTRRDPGEDPLQRAWAELFDGPFSTPARADWVRWAPSTNFAMRRPAFEALGGFAALPLPVGGEDIDLGLRLAAVGLGPIRCAPELLAHHAPDAPDRLLEKAARYGASHQLVGDRHPGYLDRRRPRALLFPDTPGGRLLRAFTRGAERVHRPPRPCSADAMADVRNGRDGRLAALRAPRDDLVDAAARAVEAAGHVALARRPGEALVYLRGPAPWPRPPLPVGVTLERAG